MSAPDAPAPARSPLLWRNADLRRVWVAQLLSQTAQRMCQLALVWWVPTVAQGHEGKAVGCLLVAGALPAIAFARPIGRAVDRLAPRRLLVACGVLATAATAIASIAWAKDVLGLVGAFGVAVVLASLHAVFDPTLSKVVPELVEPADLEGAVALQSSTQSLSAFTGALFGAALIDRLGLPGVVGLTAGAYALGALANLRVRHRLRPPPMAEGQDRGVERDVFAEVRWLRPTLLGFAAANYFMTPVLVVLPLLVRSTLGGGASMLAWLEACIWVGILGGSLFAQRLRVLDGQPLRQAAASLGLVGLALLSIGALRSAPWTALALLVAGVGLGVNNVKFVALFQRTVPAETRGRFFAQLQATIGVTFPAGFLTFGFLTDWVSPPGASLLQGLGVLAVAGYFARLAWLHSAPGGALGVAKGGVSDGSEHTTAQPVG